MMERAPQPVREMLALLRESGHTPYLVGGCVRDLLRGAEPDDYDMTSDARPEEVMALFGADAHPTGLMHGTVTLVRGGFAVEHTTERCDGAYRDSRHPESVRFTSSIEEDLARRDFTVNAIALSPEGTLVDPFGGQADLSAGVLRCVGDPARRFAEDALRILRLLRFASVLGFSVEENTARAARERRDGLRAIAHERVYAELNKLLCGEHAAAVLLEYPDILGVVLPEILPCVGFDQRNPHHCYDVWEHTARAVGAAPPTRVLRWTMLLHDLGKPKCFTQDANGIGHFYGHTAVSAEMAEEIMARLRFEHALAQGVRAQLACFDEMFPPERAAVHRMMARYGRETMWNLLQTKLADNAAKAPTDWSKRRSLGVKHFYFTMNYWRKTPAARSRSCASAAGSCWRSAFRAARSGGRSSACSTRWPRRGWRMNTALLCAARSGCTAAAGAERQTEGRKKRWRTSWIIWTGAATCR